MVSLVRETITFIQLQAKNSSKTAYTEKEKRHNSMLQVLLYILDNE